MSRPTSVVRRSRRTRTSTGKPVSAHEPDLLCFEALDRHGPLPTAYLHHFRGLKNPKATVHRFEDLFHETHTLHNGPYADRPPQQWDTFTARYQPLVHALTKASSTALAERANRYTIHAGGGWWHQFMTSCITASVELEARRSGFRYISQEEILERAPIKHLTMKVPGSEQTLTPDQLFGIDYGNGARFFAVEADRNTEPVKRATRGNSYARKLSAYRDIVKAGSYKSHFGIPTMVVLNVTVGKRHMENLRDLAATLSDQGKNSYLLFAYSSHFDHNAIPPLLTDLFTSPWLRAGYEPFNISKP